MSVATPQSTIAQPVRPLVRVRRLIALVVVVATGSVLGIASWLEASGDGLGTHQQLGLPPCGWILTMDIPCPTCGMTTSFTHAAHGRFGESFLAQPLGSLLAIATAMAFLAGLLQLVTGARVFGAFTPLWGKRTGIILAALLVGAWFFKIASWKGLV